MAEKPLCVTSFLPRAGHARYGAVRERSALRVGIYRQSMACIIFTYENRNMDRPLQASIGIYPTLYVPANRFIAVPVVPVAPQCTADPIRPRPFYHQNSKHPDLYSPAYQVSMPSRCTQSINSPTSIFVDDFLSEKDIQYSTPTPTGGNAKPTLAN